MTTATYKAGASMPAEDALIVAVYNDATIADVDAGGEHLFNVRVVQQFDATDDPQVILSDEAKATYGVKD